VIQRRVDGGIIVKRVQRIVSQAQLTKVFVIQFLGVETFCA
jgi:hypothetical protein